MQLYAHYQHVFEECRKYEKQREELNIIHLIGTSLSTINSDNKIKSIELITTIKMLKLILLTIAMHINI